MSTTDRLRVTMNHPGQQPEHQPEHLVLTTVVRYEQWDANSRQVLHGARATLQQRAAQHGLLLHGRPIERVEDLHDARRVRITLSADALPAR